ncbi:MAG: hypothetical protein NZL93_03345, partial [Chthoniobacterales bacterium]|nr:hypothetical protein [Chthoniobacterales bacterium]
QQEIMSVAEQYIELGYERGMVKGRRRGELIGRIEVMEEVLGVEGVGREVLEGMGEEELVEYCRQLEKRMRGRRGAGEGEECGFVSWGEGVRGGSWG